MITVPPKDGERIAILGGSFNPPHLGHVAICSWILKTNQAERVWVIPCFTHPLGKKLASFDDRFSMCLFAFEQLGKKVEVSDIEMRLGGTSHTIRTISYFKKHFPNVPFSFIVGGDIHSESHQWCQFDRLKDLVPIVSVPRGPDSHIPNVSATDIRDRIAKDLSIAELVPPSVAVFIITRQLYK